VDLSRSGLGRPVDRLRQGLAGVSARSAGHRQASGHGPRGCRESQTVDRRAHAGLVQSLPTAQQRVVLRPQTSEAVIQVMMIHLLIRRLARTAPYLKPSQALTIFVSHPLITVTMSYSLLEEISYVSFVCHNFILNPAIK
jgi:hypothetical protein